ncbi:Hypothetical predicted protein, partial [Pelobates cultripes]
MSDKYSNIKVFANLLAERLQFWKSLSLLTSTLRDNHLNYRWGYPAKLLVLNQEAMHAVTGLAPSIQKLKHWGIPIPDTSIA